MALIDYIQIHKFGDEIIFFGRLFARQTGDQPAHEQEEVLKRQVQFVPYNSGKLNNQSFWGIIKNSFLILKALPHAFILLAKYQPDVLVSFGSYMAVPLASVAWILRIPVITHEQTQTIGVSNKFIGIFAQKIAISHPASMAYLSKKRTALIGPVIRPQIIKSSKTTPSWYNPKTTKPIIYITGGSQGSEIINCTVGQILSQLTKKWFIIHQCGSKSSNRNYTQELTSLAKRLPKHQQNNYVVLEWLSEKDLSWALANAQLVISRAGANTVDEILFHSLPSILIPLPFAYKQEQLKNALVLADKGGAVVLEQKNLNAKNLLNTINQIFPNLHQMRQALLKVRPENGVSTLYNLIHDLKKR